MVEVVSWSLQRWFADGDKFLSKFTQLVGVYPLQKRAFGALAKKTIAIKNQHEMKDIQAMAYRYSQMLEKQRIQMM